MLREIDPAGDRAEDVAELTFPASSAGASLSARWDVEHGQAVVALPTGSLATNAPADYWLVRFAMGASAEDAR